MTGFQPMPALTIEQREALMADIAANGVLVPVVRDQHGRILDGHNRVVIADALGIDCPTVVVEVADDDAAHDLAVSLNCARRHLTREQVRELIADEIIRRPTDSDRAIARRVGCSPTTVGTVRAELRREAEERTEQIRVGLERLYGQLAAAAMLMHRDERRDWQSVGDVLERVTWLNWRTEDDVWTPDVWGPIMGRFFDSTRAYDCPPDCDVCTDFHRQWRDAHPRQVYRWAEVSNLDTGEVSAG